MPVASDAMTYKSYHDTGDISHIYYDRPSVTAPADYTIMTKPPEPVNLSSCNILLDSLQEVWEYGIVGECTLAAEAWAGAGRWPPAV